MTRTSLQSHQCSLARTVDLIGDKWALMILRDAFYGVTSFTGFRLSLGVAKTVLSDRLKRLVEGGILERYESPVDTGHPVYRLTQAGYDLFPVIVGLVQWGDKWVFGLGQEPAKLVDRVTGSPVQALAVRAPDGRVLSARDVATLPSTP